jgi:Holliday junction resolvasome RuvABC endonuclease subunit
MMNPSDVRVAGIDPSLEGTGVAIMDGRGMLVDMKVFGEPACQTDVRSRFGRFSRLVEKIMTVIDAEKPSIICIEGYSYGSSTGGVLDRMEFGGILRLQLTARESVQICEVVPTTLKKWACGKGNAKGKIPIAIALHKRYGVEFNSSDEYDCYALTRMAVQIGKHEEPATKEQAEAINTVIYGSATKQKKDAAKASKKKKPESAKLF